jgi:hypothetical protein
MSHEKIRSHIHEQTDTNTHTLILAGKEQNIYKYILYILNLRCQIN